MAPKTAREPIRHCTCHICRTHPYSTPAKEHRAINRVVATLDEKHRRRFIGVLALQWGRGSIQRLAEVTGLGRNTIRRGRNEVQRVEQHAVRDRVRQPGGGRPAVEKNTPAF